MADGKVYQFQFPYSSPAAHISQKTRGNSNYSTRHSVPVVSNRRQIEPHQAVNMAARMGWLRHVLTVLSVVIFVSIIYHFSQWAKIWKKVQFKEYTLFVSKTKINVVSMFEIIFKQSDPKQKTKLKYCVDFLAFEVIEVCIAH